jgi:hypothetical protein
LLIKRTQYKNAVIIIAQLVSSCLTTAVMNLCIWLFMDAFLNQFEAPLYDELLLYEAAVSPQDNEALAANPLGAPNPHGLAVAHGALSALREELQPLDVADGCDPLAAFEAIAVVAQATVANADVHLFDQIPNEPSRGSTGGGRTHHLQHYYDQHQSDASRHPDLTFLTRSHAATSTLAHSTVCPSATARLIDTRIPLTTLAQMKAADCHPTIQSIVAHMRHVGPSAIACSKAWRAQNGSSDADPLFDAFTNIHALRMQSSSALAEKFGLTRISIKRLTSRLAFFTLAFDRLSRWMIEEAIVRSVPKCDLLDYTDYTCYDETPMKTTVHSNAVATTKFAIQKPEQLALETASSESSSTIALRPSHVEDKSKANASATKLFQEDQSYAMLFRLQGRFVIVLGKTIAPIQAMEVNNAVVSAQCTLNNSGVSPWAEHFRSKTRATTSDKCSVNAAAERIVQRERGGGWAKLAFDCELHIAATIMGKSLAEVSADITGIIRTALSLRLSYHHNLFRRCLRTEIMEGLDVYCGPPPQEYQRYRHAVLRLFCSSHGHTALQQVLLATLPMGNWRNHSRTEFYVNVNEADLTPAMVEALVNDLANGLVMALSGTLPRLFRRDRWTGSDLAVDDVGIGLFVHNLYFRAYRRFMQEIGGGARVVGAGPLASEGDAALNVADHCMAIEDGIADTDMGAREGVANNETDASGQMSKAALNAKDRRLAWEWLSQSPHAVVALIRLLMEVMREAMASLLEMAGKTWELKEFVKAGIAAFRGEGRIQARTYRLLVGALGILEKHALDKLKALYESDIWDLIIPKSSFTCGFRSLCFRLISRLGCAIEELWANPNRKFPSKAFLVLVDPEIAREIREIHAASPCLLDEWTLEMLKEHGDQFGDDVSIHKLYTKALLMFKDIGRIEAKHASIRRQLVARSVQTHTVHLADVGSWWVLQQARARVDDALRFDPPARKRANASNRTAARVFTSTTPPQ